MFPDKTDIAFMIGMGMGCVAPYFARLAAADMVGCAVGMTPGVTVFITGMTYIAATWTFWGARRVDWKKHKSKNDKEKRER